METFLFFIKELDNLAKSVVQKEYILEFSIDYSKELVDLNSFERLLDLNKIYNESINIYIENRVQESNLIDYLDDRKEFEEEVQQWIEKKNSLKVVIDFGKIFLSYIGNFEGNLLIYYSDKEFYKEFNVNLNYVDIEKKFFNSSKNLIIIIKSQLYFYNSNIFIGNLNVCNLLEDISKFQILSVEETDKAIMFRNTSSNWVNAPSKITPKNFIIDFSNDEFMISNEIKNIIIQLTCQLILIFFSNYTTNINGKYVSTINGNKRVEIDDFENSEYYTESAYIELIMIYDWIYNDSSIDKLTICRNVISVLISAKCQGSRLKTILENTDLLSKSLYDNLSAYASGNVTAYFKERNNLKKEIAKEVSSINSQIDNIIKLLLSNFTSLLGITIAGVVGYIAKGDMFLVKILSLLYVIQLDINCLLNIPLNIIRYFESNSDFNNNVKEYKELYFEDSTLEKFKKRKKKNTMILFIYFIIIFFVIVIINFLEYKVLFDNEFIKSIISSLA